MPSGCLTLLGTQIPFCAILFILDFYVDNGKVLSTSLC